jgi:hypothetical protein
MTMTLARIRVLLVALTLAASAAVALAQSQSQSQAAQGAAAAETGPKTPPSRPDPERPAPGASSAAAAAGTQTSPRNPAYPLVNDARLTASPKSRYLGPPGTSSPFGSTDMTENQCRDMERCQVVQGQGPSYATWCRCGKGKLTTFTYIHD